jgi:hypothetical protein
MIGPLVKASAAERRTWHVPKEVNQVSCNGIMGIDTKVSGIIGTPCCGSEPIPITPTSLAPDCALVPPRSRRGTVEE